MQNQTSKYNALLEMSILLHELCKCPLLNKDAETSLTTVQARATTIVAHFEPEGITIQQLSKILKLSSGATSKLVDRIARDGIIQRIPSETDRRSVVLHVTKLAHSLSAFSKEKAETFLNLLMNDYPEKERNAYLEFNRKFTERIWELVKSQSKV